MVACVIVVIVYDFFFLRLIIMVLVPKIFAAKLFSVCFSSHRLNEVMEPDFIHFFKKFYLCSCKNYGELNFRMSLI